MKNTKLIVLRLVSTLVLLGFLSTIYWLFLVYDWGPAENKTACFLALFISVVGFHFVAIKRETPASALWIEIGILSIILVSILFINLRHYGPNALTPPVSDIGFTTEHAARILVLEHRNPYSTSEISKLSFLAPEFRGFHYGPFMMAGYLPSVFFPATGYKMASIFYLLVTLVLLVLLIVEPEESWPNRLANILFVFTAYFLAIRLWHDLFYEGANDIFPVMLILAGLLALKKDRVFWTGVFVGLSFAAKFSPALFLMPFLPFRQRRFRIGLALGITPLLPFMYWDFPGLLRCAFWLRVILPADSTSLYRVVPEAYHWMLGATLLSAMLISVYWNYLRELDYRKVLIGFTLLLIVADATQKEVHGNHLIWFYPLFAILFMYYRERLFGLLTEPAG